jgi:hypothetical protein
VQIQITLDTASAAIAAALDGGYGMTHSLIAGFVGDATTR